MLNLPQEVDNLSKYYTQIKQRIDLYLDMNAQKVVGLTKLTFEAKNEIYEEIPENLNLYLNAENININYIKLQKNSKKEIQENIGRPGRGTMPKNISSNQNLIPLEYTNSSTYDYKNYLKDFYENIEDLESFKNINRIEWEIRKQGNLIIKIPRKYIIDKNISINNNSASNKNDDNMDKNINNKNNNEKQNLLNKNNNLIQKIKIIINYKLIEKNIGIIFQEYYESRTDTSYTICYTPNFYYNTQNWVPCIYKLNLQIYWSLYLYIPDNYMAYTSCLLNQITKDANGKKLIVCKCNEQTTARNIGFISLHDKLFIRYFDQSNKNFFIVGNESKREKIEQNLINNKLISTLYNYYDEFFDINEIDIKSNLNTPTAIVFIPYLSINCPSQGFKKFLKLKDEFYFSFIKFPSLYILPEKFIYTHQLVPEISKIQLRMLSKIFITNYIGGLIIEKTYADFWIINGLESWLSNLFLNKVFDSYYIKAKLYQYILKFKKICKEGKEALPLYTNNFSHPIEMQLNPIYDLKSKIIFHLLESKVEKIFIQKALRNIINERKKKGYNISTEYLIKIFKKNCGLNLKHFMDLYVYKTGMFEINLDYTYSQKTNSIDIKIHQEQIAKYYYEKHPFFYIENIDVDFLNKVGKNIQVIDYRTKPNRYFNIMFNLNILQTNGIEIMKDIHQIKLESDKENYTQNFPLISKIRKTDLKKREQEFIQDLIDNTGINKIYSNDEIEKIFTQNSILWLRVDSEVSSLHINKINQQHILYEYIKIFRDDYVGQMESLYNIGKSEENYSKTQKILRTLIEYPNIYYKIRQYAIKIYIKILLKQKNEDEYQFLLDILDDCYNDLLKNKTSLNLETYYVMKEIVKYLGEYKETNFNKFFTVGLVTNSTMQNKIIEKFLAILFSNELNTITGYDNCYIMADILISSSKLNLQEKSNYLLKKILKNLRIEKLKRSVNEITIISTLYALINLLIRNKFFIMKEKSKFNDILNEIFQEVNYFINNDTENYELKVFLEYFHIFMIFYKSQNYSEFSKNLLFFVLGEENKNNINYSNSNINSFSTKNNLDMITKIKAMSYLFEDNILYFESIEDKIILLSSLKKILFSPICYIRGDCRYIMQELYSKFFNQEIKEKSVGKEDNNSKNDILLKKINKNYINYSSKPYADDDWLYTFINEDRASLESEDDENNDQDDLSNDTHRQGSINGINSNQIKKYKQKYKDDEYALNNIDINLDKSFNEILLDIIDKLWGHPIAEPFTYELNEETLGDLYHQYMQRINTPIDLDTIKKKILRNGYDSFMSFSKDISLMFCNCRYFNEKGSPLYIQGIHLEDYFKLITTPLKKNKLLNKNYQPGNIKIPLDNIENENKKINNEDKNNNIINNNKININLNSDIKSKSSNKNNQNDNFYKKELNHDDFNKFLIPSNIMGSNENEEGESSKNNIELLNKKEVLSKSKNHNKKNKNNKNKNKKNNTNQNSNFIINLDEKDE